MMELPKGYISYNQVRLYQICPQKYYYSYVEEIATPINDKIFLGMVFHAAVEDFLKKRMEGQEAEQKVLVEVFLEKFTALQANQQVAWSIAPEHAQKRGVAFVKHFFQDIASAIDPLMVEKELEVELPEIGIRLKGIIDLVEKDFTITDFKTTTAKWTKERINSSYLQMVIYKYLFEKSFGAVISKLKFCILYSKNGATIKDQTVTRNAADFDFEKMVGVIKYVAENISNGVFYRNESFYCGFCEYMDRCRHDK